MRKSSKGSEQIEPASSLTEPKKIATMTYAELYKQKKNKAKKKLTAGR